MAWYLSASGEAYTGDRGIRPDGTFDPEIVNRPSPDYSWDGNAWNLPIKAGDWDRLASNFNFPGNGLYSAIYNCIKLANTSDVNDHWSNFKLMIVTPALQSSAALAAGINYLVYLLSLSNQTIPSDAKGQWNALISDCGFPDTCKLD